MRCKKGYDNTSRGYCGWYTSKNNKRCYLRSKLEYVVASWLDERGVDFKTEEKIYDVNGGRYKPDFFIYIHNKLQIILEVKYSKKECVDYLKKYSELFKRKNILYIVFYEKHINQIRKKYPKISNKTNAWILNSAKIHHDMKGSKNPHYGIKHSSYSKKLIGNMTRERCKSDKYRKFLSKSVKNSFTKERRQKISESAKKRFANDVFKQEFIEAISKNINVERKCYCRNCNTSFTVMDKYDKITHVLVKYNEKICCSSSCGVKYHTKIKTDDKRKKQIRLLKIFINTFNRVPLRKEFKLYCINFNIPCDIRSTFGTHNKMIKEYVNWQN